MVFPKENEDSDRGTTEKRSAYPFSQATEAETVAKVGLVNPALVSSDWGTGLAPRHMDDALPRHSLLFLSGPLRIAGHQPILLDLRLMESWQDFEQQLIAARPEFLCVTAHTSEIEIALECCRRAKRVLPEVVVIAGGIHFTMYPHLGAEDRSVDFVIRGEGEISLPKLLRDPAAHPRVFWGEPPDLDAIPFEDRELYDDYRDRTRFQLWHLETPTVDLLTKRGCPWQCRFCCGPGEQNLFTRPSSRHEGVRLPTFRHRSVENVLDELDELYERYEFKSVVFHDDQFVIRREWVADFCRGLRRRGHVERGIQWWAASRSDIICAHPELFAAMQDAGLRILSIGFESFNDPMLRWMRKGTTRAQNFDAAGICRDLGIDIFANLILGMPFSDTKWYIEHDRESMAAIEEIRPRYFSPSFFSPIPGSWFFDWAVEQDLLLEGNAAAAGSRRPEEGKIRGVDYRRLEKMLGRYRRMYEPHLMPKRPLRLRLTHFAEKPLDEKLATIKRRIAGFLGEGGDAQ